MTISTDHQEDIEAGDKFNREALLPYLADIPDKTIAESLARSYGVEEAYHHFPKANRPCRPA